LAGGLVDVGAGVLMIVVLTLIQVDEVFDVLAYDSFC
jgi:hypothetical protein